MTAVHEDRIGAIDLRDTEGRLLWAAVGGSSLSRQISALTEVHRRWPDKCIVIGRDYIGVYESLDGPLLAVARPDGGAL